jgi:hypothetical protein
MELWKLVLDESAFQSFVSSRALERRKLLSVFESLRADPQRQADYHVQDAAGRTLNVWANRPFLITYWLDSFVSEIRIVNIQRIRL